MPVPAGPASKVVAIVYGSLCHTFFVASVVVMMVVMYDGMSQALGPFRYPGSLIANVLLLVQFPLAHSLLLTGRGRAFVSRLAPLGLGPTLVTTTYVLIAAMQVMALFLVWSPSGIVWWEASGTARVLLTAAYAGAWILLYLAIADAGLSLQTGALGWWAVFKARAPKYPPMPEFGLFRFVRQPIYLAFALTLWTVPTWTPDQLAVAIVLTSYCLVGPLFKEARFKRLFGARFEAYRRNVPYWVPSLPRPGSGRTRGPDRALYDLAGPGWWDGQTRWLRTLQNLVPVRFGYFDGFVPDWRGKAVLDIGCGGGFMAEVLARRGAAVVAVDPAEPAIEAARRHAEAGGLAIDYRVGVAEQLPLADASIDIAVCVDVLEHVDDLGGAIAEVQRVLKPGGLFLFDTVNRTLLARICIVFFAERVMQLLPRGTHDPKKFIRPAELQRALLANGFSAHPFVGMGPKGLDRRLDVTFRRYRSVAVQYLGSAELIAPMVPAAARPRTMRPD